MSTPKAKPQKRTLRQTVEIHEAVLAQMVEELQVFVAGTTQVLKALCADLCGAELSKKEKELVRSLAGEEDYAEFGCRREIREEKYPRTPAVQEEEDAEPGSELQQGE